MKCLIKKAKIIDYKSKYHGKRVDILVNNSIIEDIKTSIKVPGKIKEIESSNLHVSISWLDIGTQIGEPGLEHRENIESIAQAAKEGGYGIIACFPNTNPVLETKAAVRFVLEKAALHNIRILPIGALSENTDGKEITEMYDLHHQGVIAFSDGLKPITHSGLLLKALEYVKSFGGLIIHHAYDKTISADWQLHEGNMSTSLGMRGMPYIAEAIALKRDLELLNYTESRLCLHALSSAESIKTVKEAKKTNKQLYATVPYLNLIKTDEDLLAFDTHLKVTPPLRKKSDINELIKGLKEGTVDAIVSNHYPIDVEGKNLEFPFAKFGASGIESCFSALNTFVPQLDLETLILKLTYGPRNILQLENNGVNVGEIASMTIFDPTTKWKFNTSKSLSKNNPFLGCNLLGKVVEVLS